MSAESFRPIKFCKFEISASEKFVGAEKFFASESWRVDKVYGSEKFCQRESKCVWTRKVSKVRNSLDVFTYPVFDSRCPEKVSACDDEKFSKFRSLQGRNLPSLINFPYSEKLLRGESLKFVG